MARNNVCSFCGKPTKLVGQMIRGRIFEEQECHICASCAERCMETFEKEQQKSRRKLQIVPTPREVIEFLDHYVVGQNEAKKKLAVAIVNHYKRIQHDESQFANDPDLADVCIEKSNVILIGPTGSGKTLLARSLAQKLNVPLAIGDATTLTEAGYVGEDVENLLLKLWRAADGDINLVERGVIYIDEIDKLHKTGGNVSITRDVSGEGVQQSLLKMLEGTVCNVPPQGGRKHPEQQYIEIDTTNILFICGGSFTGIDEIISKRLHRNVMGFGGMTSTKTDAEKKNEIIKHVTHDDLEKYGLIPEFVGRLPVIAHLEELATEDLVRVLTTPKNALLRQYRKLMRIDGYDLQFTPEAEIEIAKIAKRVGTGARALRAVVESFLTDIMADPGDDKTIVIDEYVVRNAQRKSTPAVEAA